MHSQDLNDELGDQNLGLWSQGYACISGPSVAALSSYQSRKDHTALEGNSVTKVSASPS